MRHFRHFHANNTFEFFIALRCFLILALPFDTCLFLDDRWSLASNAAQISSNKGSTTPGSCRGHGPHSPRRPKSPRPWTSAPSLVGARYDKTLIGQFTDHCSEFFYGILRLCDHDHARILIVAIFRMSISRSNSPVPVSYLAIHCQWHRATDPGTISLCAVH